MASETFEYLRQSIPNPSNEAFSRTEFDNPEYKTLEHERAYFTLLLNELGSVGWELITMYDDSQERGSRGLTKVDTFIFKRGSRSKYFGTGIGVDTAEIGKTSKAIAERNTLSILM